MAKQLSRMVHVSLILGGAAAVAAIALGANSVEADKKLVSQGQRASTVTIDVKDTDITRVLEESATRVSKGNGANAMMPQRRRRRS